MPHRRRSVAAKTFAAFSLKNNNCIHFLSGKLFDIESLGERI